MNLSGYLVLATTVVSVVLAQLSNDGIYTLSIIQKSSMENQAAMVFPVSTVLLQSGYTNGTIYVSESEDIITQGISKAKEIMPVDPKAAKQILQQAFENGTITLFKYGVPTLLSLGEALAFSNVGVKEGLKAASVLIQMAGFSAFYAINDAQSLLNKGLGAGSAADKVLFEASQLAVATGYAGAYYNIRKSIQKADQALRDAQNEPMQGIDENQNCGSAAEDPVGSNAQEIINEAADNALNRGANAEFVQKLKDVLTCALGNFVDIANRAIWETDSLKTIAVSDPLGARTKFFKIVEDGERQIHQLSAMIYLALGEVAIQSGNESNSKIAAAITAVTRGQSEIGLSVKSGEEFIILGLRYQPNEPKLAFEASHECGIYAKTAYIQGIADCAQLAFSVL